MADTLEEIEALRNIVRRLAEQGVPEQTLDRIREWIDREEERIRNNA